jgi:hypothetical protein
MRGEDAVTAHHVDRRARRDRGERLQPFDGLEEAMREVIAPDGLERDEDAPVGPELDAVPGERRAEDVTGDELLPRLVLRPEDAVLDKMRTAVPGATE